LIVSIPLTVAAIFHQIPTAPPESISAASIGIPDTFFLMILALIVFGPRRLPEIGRQIGKLMYEFRKVSNDFKFQMEEELRASEEADRVRKLEAVSATQTALPVVDVARLDVPPYPVSEAEPLAMTDGAVSAGSHMAEEYVPAMDGEVRGEAAASEAASSGPTIQAPASGETVAAQKPFRYRTPDAPPERVAEPQTEPVTDSGSPAVHEPVEPLSQTLASDEGRTGTEVQPGIAASPRVEAASTGGEVHHG
jgi:sec-independent protein translocase protein TatB